MGMRHLRWEKTKKDILNEKAEGEAIKASNWFKNESLETSHRSTGVNIGDSDRFINDSVPEAPKLDESKPVAISDELFIPDENVNLDPRILIIPATPNLTDRKSVV